MTMLRLPGLVDAHVHLREPGQIHKEDFASGTAAALAGGFTTVLAMPTTQPPLTTPETLAAARSLAQAGARCDVGLFAGAAAGNAPLLPELAAQACGLKVYLDATFGPLRVNDLPVLLEHFTTWPGPGPIAVHAEGNTVAQVLGLVAATGQRVHFCHVSRRAEILLIARAKERGLPITCEVTPHHLFLDEEDAARLGPYGQMRPPLQTAADRQGLWEMLDYVDCVATDHAPHTCAEKDGATPPPGVPGLETALPLLLTAVHEECLTPERVVELLAHGPRRIFGLPPAEEETWVEVDVDAAWTLPSAGWQTRANWSPFAGRPVRGRVMQVRLRGRVACADGVVVAEPGSGRVLF